MIKYKLLYILFLFIVGNVDAQTNYFVGTNGSDTNDGLTQNTALETVTYAVTIASHGDTIYVLPGTYSNTTYGVIDVWKIERTIFINNKTTTSGDYLVIKPLIENAVILKGDGDFIIQIKNSNNIRFQGFQVEGESNNISLNFAKQYQFTYKDANGTVLERVPLGSTDAVIETLVLPILINITRPTYFNTSGISVNSSHHIDIRNNTVYDMPGEGIRSFTSDYLNIINNEVYGCAKRSATGVHGLSVYTLNSNVDGNNSTTNDFRVFITNNIVHDNYNELYSWSAKKTFISTHIDEGKGITVQRSTPSYSWNYGKIKIQNNISYKNGFSGIHVNSGTGIEIINNTCYENNQTSLITNEGNSHGISIQDGNDILIANNIIISNPGINNGRALKISSNSGNSGFLNVTDNLIQGTLNPSALALAVNTSTLSPLFNNALNNNFNLQSNSPAIGLADASFSPTDDFYFNQRDSNPDLGAIEYVTPLSNNELEFRTINIYPNPFIDRIIIEEVLNFNEVSIFNVLGQNMINYISVITNSLGTEILTANLPNGMYVIKTKTFARKMYKNKGM